MMFQLVLTVTFDCVFRVSIPMNIEYAIHRYGEWYVLWKEGKIKLNFFAQLDWVDSLLSFVQDNASTGRKVSHSAGVLIVCE